MKSVKKGKIETNSTVKIGPDTDFRNLTPIDAPSASSYFSSIESTNREYISEAQPDERTHNYRDATIVATLGDALCQTNTHKEKYSSDIVEIKHGINSRIKVITDILEKTKGIDAFVTFKNTKYLKPIVVYIIAFLAAIGDGATFFTVLDPIFRGDFRLTLLLVVMTAFIIDVSVIYLAPLIKKNIYYSKEKKGTPIQITYKILLIAYLSVWVATMFSIIVLRFSNPELILQKTLEMIAEADPEDFVVQMSKSGMYAIILFMSVLNIASSVAVFIPGYLTTFTDLEEEAMKRGEYEKELSQLEERLEYLNVLEEQLSEITILKKNELRSQAILQCAIAREELNRVQGDSDITNIVTNQSNEKTSQLLSDTSYLDDNDRKLLEGII